MNSVCSIFRNLLCTNWQEVHLHRDVREPRMTRGREIPLLGPELILCFMFIMVWPYIASNHKRRSLTHPHSFCFLSLSAFVSVCLFCLMSCTFPYPVYFCLFISISQALSLCVRVLLFPRIARWQAWSWASVCSNCLCFLFATLLFPENCGYSRSSPDPAPLICRLSWSLLSWTLAPPTPSPPSYSVILPIQDRGTRGTRDRLCSHPFANNLRISQHWPGRHFLTICGSYN